MQNNFLRYLLIAVIVTVVSFGVRFVRHKLYKPKYEDNVQKPGKLETFIANFLLVLGVFLLLLTIAGLLMQEMEMVLVMGAITLIYFALVFVLKRAHDTSYQENEEYFILTVQKKEYKVFYEDITDWQPFYNEIGVFDKTQPEKDYIRVNIKIFKPEILLRKIADMAVEGKFDGTSEIFLENQDRTEETINYIVNNRYGYLVDDYVKQINDN